LLVFASNHQRKSRWVMAGRYAKPWRGVYRWTLLEWVVVGIALATFIVELVALLT
jgi:hypothetical protein